MYSFFILIGEVVCIYPEGKVDVKHQDGITTIKIEKPQSAWLHNKIGFKGKIVGNDLIAKKEVHHVKINEEEQK